jgi:hypothetical protein
MRTYIRTPLLERAERLFIPEPNSGCWLWMARLNKHGYGIFKVESKQRPAHRVVYEQTIGPIPQGMLACHRCDTPSCVNPEHIFIGTARDNTNDCVAKGRIFRHNGSRRGEANTRALLSESQVRIILASKSGKKRLAKAFGVHVSTIASIRKGRTWKHLWGFTQ